MRVETYTESASTSCQGTAGVAAGLMGVFSDPGYGRSQEYAEAIVVGEAERMPQPSTISSGRLARVYRRRRGHR